MKATQLTLKSSKGITLIALVITIIVLIILAGVTINTLTGDNSIINKAEQAKNASIIAAEKEKIQIVHADLMTRGLYNEVIDDETFQVICDDTFGTSTTQAYVDKGKYYITIKKTGNTYEIDDDGKVLQIGNAKDAIKDTNPGTLEEKDGKYVINSIEDLVAFAYNINSGTELYNDKTVTLGKNLYFNGVLNSYANENAKYELEENLGYKLSESSSKTLKEMLTTGTGFIPIGQVDSINTFKGTFDGNNKYISGLYINSNAYSSGLFGFVQDRITIKNLGMKNTEILGTSTSKGTILGCVGKGIVLDNCYHTGTLKINSTSIRTGGLIGSASGESTITKCFNESGYRGRGDFAGIIGEFGHYDNISDNTTDSGGLSLKTLNITKCYNTGDIEVSSSCAAGIINSVVEKSVYKNKLELRNCYNTGNITGPSYGGGIVAKVESIDMKVDSCYNKGKINGDRIAGIISYAFVEDSSTQYLSSFGYSINSCYNDGEIYGTYAAGVVNEFRHYNLALQTTSNYAKITGSVNASGVIGVGGAQGGSGSALYNYGIVESNSGNAAGVSRYNVREFRCKWII